MPYITPANTPVNSICWRIFIPDDKQMLAAFLGQLLELSNTRNWESIGGMTEQECADIWSLIQYDFSTQDGCMIGTIQHYINDTIPSNLLPCNGANHLRTDYPKLYDILPASLIVDADNFTTPILENNFVLSSGATYPELSTGGLSENTQTVGQLAPHSHNSPPHSHAESGATNTAILVNAGAPVPSAIPIPTTTAPSSAVIENTGSGDPINNMPPYVALKVGIVAK